MRPRSHSPAHSPLQGAAETSPDTAQSERSNPPRYAEVHNNAATKIQSSYRIHRSLCTIEDLERQLNQLKSSLVLPTILDFEGPDGTITVTVTEPTMLLSSSASTFDIAPLKLAYTTNNYAIHSYTESLNRLLMKLDSVESWGASRVRRSRKAVVRRIEEQASEVEAYCKRAWIAYHERTSTPAVPASNDNDDVVMKEKQTQQEQEQVAEGTNVGTDDEDVETSEKEMRKDMEEETEVQMMVVDAISEITPSSPSPSTHLVDTSAVTIGHESDDDDYVDALPRLYHTDHSDSSDSDLDFEDAEEETNTSQLKSEPTVVVASSDLDSSSKDGLLLERTIGGEMVSEPAKGLEVVINNVHSSVGDFVMVE
jgi:BAG domain